MFGGVDDVYQVEETRLGDTWELDERGWRLVSTTGPYPWFGRGSAYDTKDRVVRKHGAGSEAWEWDGTTWTNRGYHNACTTFFMAMAHDDRRGRMVLQGGFPGCPNPFYSDTYEWNGDTWVFVSDWGPIFQGHPGNLVYDSWRGVCVAYGAEDTFGYTYEWDGTDWHVLNPPSPPRRYAGAMAFDSRRGVTVLFGGSNNEATTLFGDTWEYNGVSWRQVASSGPSPRTWHNMAYDSWRGVTVLFGGWDGKSELNDTWEWNGKEWREFTPVVSCYADCDTSTGRFVLDIFDFLCFQNRFAAGGPYACDCDASTGPGVCDIYDFLCFQDAFAAGCP